MMADCAARGGARDAVVPGDMPGDTAHDRAFGAPFCVSRGMGERERCGEREGTECLSGSFQLGLRFSIYDDDMQQSSGSKAEARADRFVRSRPCSGASARNAFYR